jgi:hypothetical protein
LHSCHPQSIVLGDKQGFCFIHVPSWLPSYSNRTRLSSIHLQRKITWTTLLHVNITTSYLLYDMWLLWGRESKITAGTVHHDFNFIVIIVLKYQIIIEINFAIAGFLDMDKKYLSYARLSGIRPIT